MSTLTPHGACLLWKPELIWLNAVSDALLAVAFFVTAFVLAVFVWRRRRDVMFRGVSGHSPIFAAFCGVTRLLSILTLWVPAYGIESLVKGFLALVSLGRHGGVAADAAAAPGAADPHAACARQCGARGGNRTPPQGRGHGPAFSGDRGQRGPGPAGAEDGSHRPAHRRRRARLQQHADRDHRHIEILADAVKDRRSSPRSPNDQRRRGAGRRPDAASAGLRAPAAAAAAQHRRQRAGRRSARLLRPTLGEQIEIESMLAHDPRRR